ncbi:MAG: energy transducer TonB [Pyrinomonadaceae bacterium]
MLDHLIESKSNGKENKSRGGFLLTTFVLVAGLLFSAVLWSLFAKDLGTGNDSLELSTLVAPLQTLENKPPEPMPKQEKSKPAKSDVPFRPSNIQRIEESPIAPKEVSVAPSAQKSRPVNFSLTADKLDNGEPQGSPLGNRDGKSDVSGIGIQDTVSSPTEISKKIEPPPSLKKSPVEPRKKTVIKSTGVINGQAKYLPKPVYSVAAKAVRANGAVNVQVLVDEAGNVISANAVDGHPLLKVEAERAARNAKFNPTLLNGSPVKVSGIIVYKFSMQ